LSFLLALRRPWKRTLALRPAAFWLNVSVTLAAWSRPKLNVVPTGGFRRRALSCARPLPTSHVVADSWRALSLGGEGVGGEGVDEAATANDTVLAVALP
jgi:hypothetical protein